MDPRPHSRLADPLAGYTWGTGSDLVLTNGDAGEVNGAAVLDGSLKNGMIRELRVGVGAGGQGGKS